MKLVGCPQAYLGYTSPHALAPPLSPPFSAPSLPPPLRHRHLYLRRLVLSRAGCDFGTRERRRFLCDISLHRKGLPPLAIPCGGSSALQIPALLSASLFLCQCPLMICRCNILDHYGLIVGRSPLRQGGRPPFETVVSEDEATANHERELTRRAANFKTGDVRG